MYGFNNTKNLVHRILVEEPRTRNSDNLLYLSVIRHVSAVNGVNLEELKVVDFLSDNLIKKEFPPFETVRRARQRVQEKNPSLQATEGVRAVRALKEIEMRELVRY